MHSSPFAYSLSLTVIVGFSDFNRALKSVGELFLTRKA